MSKITVGELTKKHGNSNRPATHFFHPGMKRVYKASLKPHLDYALKNFPKVYVPKRKAG
jgi:hypothetical protein